MKTKTLSWSDIEGQVHELAHKINKSKWRPDYVVGLTRGGLVPAVLLSNLLDVPMETLKVQLRDGGSCESNGWMSEEAFGYVPLEERKVLKSRWDGSKKKNILIVDDINDSGDTFNWIKSDWQNGCMPNDLSWEKVWGNNVRFAVLVENIDSSFESCYSATEINKAEDDVWINFPWESGWWIQHKKEL
jgi:uncharacterized protein